MAFNDRKKLSMICSYKNNVVKLNITSVQIGIIQAHSFQLNTIIKTPGYSVLCWR
jgi:hypothetical protein